MNCYSSDQLADALVRARYQALQRKQASDYSSWPALAARAALATAGVGGLGYLLGEQLTGKTENKEEFIKARKRNRFLGMLSGATLGASAALAPTAISSLFFSGVPSAENLAGMSGIEKDKAILRRAPEVFSQQLAHARDYANKFFQKNLESDPAGVKALLRGEIEPQLSRDRFLGWLLGDTIKVPRLDQPDEQLVATGVLTSPWAHKTLLGYLTLGGLNRSLGEAYRALAGGNLPLSMNPKSMLEGLDVLLRSSVLPAERVSREAASLLGTLAPQDLYALQGYRAQIGNAASKLLEDMAKLRRGLTIQLPGVQRLDSNGLLITTPDVPLTPEQAIRIQQLSGQTPSWSEGLFSRLEKPRQVNVQGNLEPIIPGTGYTAFGKKVPGWRGAVLRTINRLTSAKPGSLHPFSGSARGLSGTVGVPLLAGLAEAYLSRGQLSDRITQILMEDTQKARQALNRLSGQ